MKPNTAQSLLAMIPVKNEANRYLTPVLNHLAAYVDGIVVLDDASTDETGLICRAHPSVISYRFLEKSLFQSDESALRKILWEMTVELNPGWILSLDADEIFESSFRKELPHLLNQTKYNLISFSVYHFWGDLCHYRVDRIWNPLVSGISCLYRYRKDQEFHWPSRRLHCGRLPVEAYRQSAYRSTARLLHLGYADPKDHLRKYQRYTTLDPAGIYCPLSHYHSIITKPTLQRWIGEKLEGVF